MPLGFLRLETGLTLPVPGVKVLRVGLYSNTSIDFNLLRSNSVAFLEWDSKLSRRSGHLRT